MIVTSLGCYFLDLVLFAFLQCWIVQTLLIVIINAWLTHNIKNPIPYSLYFLHLLFLMQGTIILGSFIASLCYSLVALTIIIQTKSLFDTTGFIYPYILLIALLGSEHCIKLFLLGQNQSGSLLFERFFVTMITMGLMTGMRGNRFVSRLW